MELFTAGTESKIHRRNIEITTYTHGPDDIIIEGKLIEDRLCAYYHFNGGKREPHTVHHMEIRLLLECATLTIREIQGRMPGIPHPECDQTLGTLAGVRGLRLAPGFTSRIRKMMGGRRGCLHMTTLLLSMAPAAMQGYWVKQAQTPRIDDLSPEMMQDYLIDTCWVWRKGGPHAAQVLAATRNNSKDKGPK